MYKGCSNSFEPNILNGNLFYFYFSTNVASTGHPDCGSLSRDLVSYQPAAIQCLVVYMKGHLQGKHFAYNHCIISSRIQNSITAQDYNFCFFVIVNCFFILFYFLLASGNINCKKMFTFCKWGWNAEKIFQELVFW